MNGKLFTHLASDIADALADYDQRVAAGLITFAPNGHSDSPVHPEAWLPAYLLNSDVQ